MNVGVPERARPGSKLVFSVDEKRTSSALPCVAATASAADDKAYEAMVPSFAAAPEAKVQALQVLLPNHSLAIVKLPEGAAPGNRLTFKVLPASPVAAVAA